MGENSSKEYIEQLMRVSAIVEKELPAFKVMTPKRKIQSVTKTLKENCMKRNSANSHRAKETNSLKHKLARMEDEYLELLTSTRLSKELAIMDESELSLYVTHLQSKLEETLIDKDVKKRFFMYDYIMTGCRACKSDCPSIVEQIEIIRNSCKQIIEDIPTM